MRTPLVVGIAVALVAGTVASFQTPAMAQAAESEGTQKKADADPWRVRLGAVGEYVPDYEGSDDYELDPLPLLELQYRDVFFFRNRELSVNLVPGSERFRLLVGAKYTWARDEDDNAALDGLGDIDDGFAGTLRGEYSLLRPVTLVAELERDVSGTHDGLLARLGTEVGVPLSEDLKAQLSVQGTWADENYMGAYYGIDPAQAAASGLPRHTAQAGVKDIETALDLRYALASGWSLDVGGAYARLLGDAADSPIVDGPGSADQFMFRIGLSYGFGFDP